MHCSENIWIMQKYLLNNTILYERKLINKVFPDSDEPK